MKKALYAFIALCLALSAGTVYAVTEDFSDGYEFSPDADWTSADGWIYNQPNWQVVVHPTTYDNGYQCIGSSQAANQRGLTTYNGGTYQDVIVEADIYNLVDEVGIAVRGIEHFTGGWETIAFYIHEWGTDGKGACYFTWFYPFDGAPAEAWDAKARQAWAPEGAYPHGTNRIHAKVTAIGNTFRGQAWAYNEFEELVASVDTSYTFTSDLVVRPGAVGLAAYSSNHIFDNINVTAVPEPSSIMALVTGLGFAAAAIRRRRA